MAGWFTQGWEVKARALHSLKTLKPQHVSAETCPKELTPAPSWTFIRAGMMFSEIKHPHFKLHPQGHGGFAETLAGLFRGGGGGGGGMEGGNRGPRGLQCVGGLWAGLGVFSHRLGISCSRQNGPEPPRTLEALLDGNDVVGDEDYAAAGLSPPSDTWVREADTESWQPAPSTRCQQ